ncbi:ATP-grasp domain-containing protein [Bacteroides thetaiotaomicron]|uniref:ATP-grasp domain-containing protein n=1 Tax=Bacteroides thetaiotaomicron TaxID=818 RepID=UPI0021656D16|nr:ATP-grasp domain-containing protein [Bacteroides thetaiotaomicron]MCS2449204.1 ATP-grasp domain-containing protein [Bacteroides thetaiotaomicron]
MNILLTSAGRRTYLVNYFKDSLKGKGLVHAANNIMTYTLSQADRYVITPDIYDERYIDFLIDYCKDSNITAILSFFDVDLPVLAKNKRKFGEQGITVVVSDECVTRICNDKWMTYCFIKKIGLKQASAYISLSEAKEALKKGEIAYPLIIKPRWGMGSIGIFQVENDEELDVLYCKLQREIFDTYLKYESQVDVGACVLIQTKVEGQEYGLDVLNDLDGNYVTTVVKKKLAMRAGETDIAQVVDNSSLARVGRVLSENLRHIADLDVDCFVLENGDIYVLELNCRFGGQYPFSHNAGVNFPKQIVEWLEGRATDVSLVTPGIGIKSCKNLEPVIISYDE